MGNYSKGPSMKDSKMKMQKQMAAAESPAKMNNSPMQMKGSWMSKHCSK